jgi:excinuclease ABC subunit C
MENSLTNSLPQNPGIYKFYNKEEILIYVGKAKNIKKRVSSYFKLQASESRKTKRLVSEIRDIKFVIVDSEFDALLLENNLIKENQPKYNILLKDDKSFPYICISNDRFPKIFSTRRYNKDQGDYFGPYTSVKAMNNVLDLLRNLYKIRTCNLNLSAKNIEQKKFKLCLEYHIGNCLAPCEKLQSESDYLKEIAFCRNILKGHLGIVKSYFKENMQAASEALDFEAAQNQKEKLNLLDKFQTKTLIVNQKLNFTDIFSLLTFDKRMIVNYTKIDNGIINISDTFHIDKKLEEADEDLMKTIIVDTRQKFESNNKLVLTNIDVESWDEQIKIIVPKVGDKKQLIDLSIKNVLAYKKDLLNKKENSHQSARRIIRQLQADLKLSDLPAHIECFDNSNLQGTNPVASMVCFKNARPSKKDYRHFKIKTVVGPDDFGSMTEIVSRRYARLIKEEKPLPNLIIVDGGKGQLSAACIALKALGIYKKVPIIGIAKRLEEIYYPEDSIPLYISKKSESLKLIQQLRDEAHRFAITFHRQLRSKNSINSELDSIKGIGEKTRQLLLQEFKSISNMKTASELDIEQLIGKKKTALVLSHFKNLNS